MSIQSPGPVIFCFGNLDPADHPLPCEGRLFLLLSLDGSPASVNSRGSFSAALLYFCHVFWARTSSNSVAFPSTKKGKWAKSHPESWSYLQLMSAGRGKISLLQWSDTGYINLTPGQVPCSRIVSQHKMDSMLLLLSLFLVCFVLFEIEKKNMILGRQGGGEDLGEFSGIEKNIIKIYHKLNKFKCDKNK